MAQSLEQFGATIKLKYPQYKDISDIELGQKMLTKYPQYKDMVTINQTQQKPLLQKAGEGVLDFLGMKGLRNLATSFGITRDKEYRRIVDKIEKGGNATQGELAYLNSLNQSLTEVTPTAKQVAGSVIETGATLATLGVKPGNILPTATKLAGIGAVAGFGSGLQENKSVEDSLKQSFTTGLASAATVGTISAISKLGKLGLSKLPNKIYSSAAKLDSATANVMINEKQIGTLGRLNGIAQQETRKLNETIAAKIAEKNGEINTKAFLKTVTDKIKNKWSGASEKQINASIKSFKLEPLLKGGKIDFKVADNIRQGIGTDLQTIWRQEDPKFKGDVGKIIWQELVNTIRPSTNTTNEFSRLAAYTNAAIKTSKILKNQESKFGLKLTDLVLGGAAGVGGGGLAGVGAVVAKKAIESPLVKTAVSVGLNEVNKFIDRIPAQYFDKTGRITRTALVKAISELSK
jgi:hypothetical protein